MGSEQIIAQKYSLNGRNTNTYNMNIAAIPEGRGLAKLFRSSY